MKLPKTMRGKRRAARTELGLAVLRAGKRGSEHLDEARKTLKAIPWAALAGFSGGAIASTPGISKHVFGTETSFGRGIKMVAAGTVIGTVGTVIAAGVRYAHGRALIAGGLKKQLKPLVFGKPLLARRAAKNLAKLGLPREFIEKVLAWGKGKG